MLGHWSKDDEATLTKMWRAGASAATIALVLGRSIQAIDAKIDRLGLRSDPHEKVSAMAGDRRFHRAMAGRRFKDI